MILIVKVCSGWGPVVPFRGPKDALPGDDRRAVRRSDHDCLMSGSVSRRVYDLNAIGDLDVAINKHRPASRKRCPRVDGVVGRGGDLGFRLLNDDARLRKPAVLAAVVEVEMGVDDGQDRMVGIDASNDEFVAEVQGDRLVPVVDHVVAETDAGVDENRPVAMVNQECVDRKRHERRSALGMKARKRSNTRDSDRLDDRPHE